MSVLIGWMLAVAAVWWAGLALALRKTRSERFKVGPECVAAPGSLSVSIVIPARDEVGNIADCVAAALAQDHPALQVVVLDDGSTDGTTEVLQGLVDPRLTVVDGGGGPLPEGWLGKPWACERAAGHATGSWLLFVDADVRLAPEAVSRSLGYALEHELSALSGLGTLLVSSLWERVLQPVVVFWLVVRNPLSQVNNPDMPDKVLANGQFILVSRVAYEQVGRHGAVANNVLDDIGLARAFKAARVPYHVVFMRRLFATRMYDGFFDLWAGWRKNIFAEMGWSWSRLLGVVVAQSLFVVGPYGVLVAALLSRDVALAAAASVAVLGIQAVRFYLDGVFGAERLTGIWSHGLANALLLLLVIDSAVSTSLGLATWKGRTLPAGEQQS